MATESSLHPCAVKWYRKCYMCSAPLDFAAMIREDKLEAFYTYARFKPINFSSNLAYRKIIGLNLRDVCRRCYVFKKCEMIPGPRELCSRECTGTSKFLKFKRQPLSQSDVYNWFEGFYEFSERSDLEQYLIKTKRYAIYGLIVIIWPEHSYID